MGMARTSQVIRVSICNSALRAMLAALDKHVFVIFNAPFQVAIRII